MFPKDKKIRLTGNALSKLNNDIHERDRNQCIIDGCGLYIAPGEKFHHEPCGRGNKEDRIEKGCSLCNGHHFERHHGKNSAEIQRQCEEYLSSLYPNVWQQQTGAD